MMKTDICVIGAGSAGLSVAAAAAQMGRKVVLIEKHLMGGDCLNFGCVPSKALIAAAHQAHAMRNSAAFGISPVEPVISGPGLNQHIHEIIAQIAPEDSQERFEGLGCHVIRAPAQFIDKTTLKAGSETIRARRFVIATGSRAFIPDIPGLASAPYLTNETIFSLTEIPEHLMVLGAGPIGVEIAQSYQRLGAKVTLIGRPKQILPKEDPELSAIIAEKLAAEGVTLKLGLEVKAVQPGLNLELSDGSMISGSHLLIAAGRRAVVENLGLEAAHIAYSEHGIVVDKAMRSSNRRIYAIGDVAGGPQFTHVANYHAGLFIRSALFCLPVRENRQILPRVTYCDPELAQIGLSEAEAQGLGLNFKVERWPFARNDRARAERQSAGLVKIIIGPRGKILGAGIAGPHAGDLLGPWILAISQGLKISALAGMVAPYPSLGEASRRAAMAHYAGLAQKPALRGFLQLLSWFG